MSKVTDLTGAQAQSFDLIMRKEFAKQIIDGIKKLEFFPFLLIKAKKRATGDCTI